MRRNRHVRVLPDSSKIVRTLRYFSKSVEVSIAVAVYLVISRNETHQERDLKRDELRITLLQAKVKIVLNNCSLARSNLVSLRDWFPLSIRRSLRSSPWLLAESFFDGA